MTWLIAGALMMAAAVFHDPRGRSSKAGALYLLGSALFCAGVLVVA